MFAVRAILIAAALSLPLGAAGPCSTAAFAGSYGLRLWGTSTLSGSPTPFADLSRLLFDGEGGITGYSSVNFNGLLLGNPVTGAYEVNRDCTMSWSLQDDSGAFQHFTGTLFPNGSRVDLRQTDFGIDGHGAMLRTSTACTASDVRPSYAFVLSGTATPLAGGDVPGTISAQGVLHIDGVSRATLIQTFDGEDVPADGTWSVESDCTFHFEFALPVKTGKTAVPMALRGILVNQGQQILAIQTNPATVAAVRFTAN
jgi:hypothetical protein